MTTFRAHRQSRPRKRRGAFMIVALVCVLVSGLLMAALLKHALMQRRQGNYEEQAMQAEWLLQSGIERAANRLAASADYRGENWDLPPADSAETTGGAVKIDVRPREDHPQEYVVTVEARFPVQSPRSAKRTRQFIIQAASTTPGDKT